MQERLHNHFSMYPMLINTLGAMYAELLRNKEANDTLDLRGIKQNALKYLLKRMKISIVAENWKNAKNICLISLTQAEVSGRWRFGLMRRLLLN